MENLKTKRKQEKFVWSSRAGIQTLEFLKFPPTIWIIEGDGIKSRQKSLIFLTLSAVQKLQQHNFEFKTKVTYMVDMEKYDKNEDWRAPHLFLRKQ